MEVIAGISSIVQIIDSVTRVAKRLNEVRESYNNVALNTTLVASQLSTIRAALEALHAWRASDRDSTGPSKQLDKDLGMSLSCCAILISVIDGKLDDSGYMPGLKQKIKYLWLEDTLKEYVSNLEGQVRALQLLLTIFQCRTEAEKRQKLGNEENRTIMEQVRAETASLALENLGFQDAASVLSLDPSVTFDVDSILMRSPAYKRVYGGARLRLPPVAITNPTETSEQAARPASTPFLNETLQPPHLPSRPTRQPMPQNFGRINVRDYYPGEKEEETNVDGTIIADFNNVFELPGEIQESSAVSQRNEKSKEEQDVMLQCEETAIGKVYEDLKTTSVDPLFDSASERKPLSMRHENAVATALPAVADTESVSSLEGFVNQLNLAFAEKSPSQDNNRDPGLFYQTAVPLKAERSHAVAVSSEEAIQAFSRNNFKKPGRHSNSLSEDSGLDFSRRESFREESQRPMSTHSSLYECSILPVPNDESTGTSSPYSCVSCRNGDVTDYVWENDKLEAEIHDLVRLSPQPGSGSANAQRDATDQSLLRIKILDQSQQTPMGAIADTLNELQSQSPKDVLTLVPSSTVLEQHTHDKDPAEHCTALIDDLAKPESEGLERIETSPSVAGLGLQRVETSETSGTQSETSEPCSCVHPPRPVAPTKPLACLSPSAVVSFRSAELRDPEVEQSALSSDRSSSAHDATSTILSSEASEDSNTSSLRSLQQSTPNSTATSISTHAPALDPNQTLSDLRGLQNELATAKARGDSNSPKKPPSLRISRFLSLNNSSKDVALGDSAASGDTISVQKILKEKVNVNSRSDSFKTPLMRAAMNGHIECMKLLKQSGADEFAVDAKERTALHMAVASSQLAVVKWLLENYLPPKADLLRHRPSILVRATDVVKGVRSQRNLREASDAEGSKPLHIAAELDKGRMVKILVAAGVDIESKDNRGRTPFHRAILSKRRDSFDTLIRSGAHIAAVDAKSATSLHLAAEAGQVDMIETLLAKGAKPWDFDGNGNQPIHSAVRGGNVSAIKAFVADRTNLDKRTKLGQTLLHLACLEKDLDVATYLLTKLVDVNPWAAPSSGVLQALSHTKVKGSSMTPLHYACCMRDFEMAVLLLDHEALVNAPTPEGATALMMAVETEDTNMVNLLLQRGAKVNAKIPGSLITALHLAARRGDLETVQQLCRKGADYRARTNNYGRSPLDECSTCPDKKKSQAVAEYIWTIVTNNRRNRAYPRNLQASRTESSQSSYNPSGAQISPLADPVSYAPWARTRQGYVSQQEQGQNPQYYHPDFDVPDEILPAYEPGPSAPARFASQAPVYRE